MEVEEVAPYRLCFANDLPMARESFGEMFRRLNLLPAKYECLFEYFCKGKSLSSCTLKSVRWYKQSWAKFCARYDRQLSDQIDNWN